MSPILTKLAIFMASGAAVAAVANAAPSASDFPQSYPGPYVVNIAGATLLQPVFLAPASTNDFINVDLDFIDSNGNGIFDLAAERFVAIGEQLAPNITAGFGVNLAGTLNALALAGNPNGNQANNLFMVVQYYAVGSGNGLATLDQFGTIYAQGPDGQDLDSNIVDRGLINRVNFRTGTGLTGAANPLNPFAAPVRTLKDGSYLATTSTDDAISGLQIDIAPLDVPVTWAITQSGSPDPLAFPLQSGYGNNTRIAVDKQGNPTARNNKLETLLVGNTNLASPDALTIFDTVTVSAPVVAMVNPGLDLAEITRSGMRHLFATGRLQDGTNPMVITRDSGSGTRNGFANGIGIDPSFTIGENVGAGSAATAQSLIGPNFEPSNKLGSSRVEEAVIYHRLGVGHQGATRAVTGSGTGSFLLDGRAEILGVLDDDNGGTVFARPTLQNLINNDANGYNVFGPAVYATYGDPRAEPVVLGGANNGNPRMRNQVAAAYINNQVESLAAFISVPTDVTNIGTPGEYLAEFFLPIGASTFIPDRLDSNSNGSGLDLVPNPDVNPALQAFLLSPASGSVFKNPAFATFGFGAASAGRPAGTVPVRTANIQYTDFAAAGNAFNVFVSQSGTLIPYNSNLSLRNKTAGDFNGNGVRDLGDAVGMIAAWRQRNGGPVWVAPNGSGPIAGAPGGDAIIEVLGDFTGDGNFDAEDIRYWADGLATVNGQLDRVTGFTAVDDAFGGNFFGTTKATGASYIHGDSRADIASSVRNNTPGFVPTADGVIDATDIDYVYANFGVWSNLSDAINMDLSADINGDLIVDIFDVCEVLAILGTSFGDVNLDGVVDATDIAIVQSNLGQPGLGWAGGDVNGDGIVDQTDLDIVTNNINLCDPSSPCEEFDITDSSLTPGSSDGVINAFDLNIYISLWLAGDPLADLTDASLQPNSSDGVVNSFDLNYYVNGWLTFQGSCP